MTLLPPPFTKAKPSPSVCQSRLDIPSIESRFLGAAPEVGRVKSLAQTQVSDSGAHAFAASGGTYECPSGGVFRNCDSSLIQRACEVPGAAAW